MRCSITTHGPFLPSLLKMAVGNSNIQPNPNKVDSMVVAGTSLLIGFLYYVLFRPQSAYYVDTFLSSLSVPPVLCNLIPDYLWGISFAATLNLTGMTVGKSVITVTFLGCAFEMWQLLTGIGSAYFSDILAYALGAMTAQWMAYAVKRLRVQLT